MEQAVVDIGAALEAALTTIAVSVVVGAIGAAIAFIIRLIKGEGALALLVGLDTFITTAAGSFLAWLVLRVLLELTGNSDAGAAVFGTLFLIWPGLVDVGWAGITAIFRPEAELVLIDAAALPWFAFAVGAGVGLFDGYRRIHRWKGMGILKFVADVTWGLPLAVNAFIIHVRNVPGLLKVDPVDGRRVTVHEDAPRVGTHRYLKGFRLKAGYAFTQGSVISNLEVDGGLTPSAPGFAPLLAHETVHVFQNRVFGPTFWYSYVFWLVGVGLVAVIVSAFAKPKTGTAAGQSIPFWWAYMDNPWEVWAYSKNPGARTWVTDGSLCWPPLAVIVTTVIAAVPAIAVFVTIVAAAF
ncbi:MAG: hypothetical protein AB7O56_12075 [Bauldia sp.]